MPLNWVGGLSLAETLTLRIRNAKNWWFLRCRVAATRAGFFGRSDQRAITENRLDLSNFQRTEERGRESWQDIIIGCQIPTLFTIILRCATSSAANTLFLVNGFSKNPLIRTGSNVQPAPWSSAARLCQYWSRTFSIPRPTIWASIIAHVHRTLLVSNHSGTKLTVAGDSHTVSATVDSSGEVRWKIGIFTNAVQTIDNGTRRHISRNNPRKPWHSYSCRRPRRVHVLPRSTRILG